MVVYAGQTCFTLLGIASMQGFSTLPSFRSEVKDLAFETGFGFMLNYNMRQPAIDQIFIVTNGMIINRN